MTVEEKVNIINNLRSYVVELKASSESINSEFENILKGLQEIREHESTPIIADIIFEYEKFIFYDYIYFYCFFGCNVFFNFYLNPY